MMNDWYDLIIIGAGPAGLGAACEACIHGLSVIVLDEQPGPGGQIFRSIEHLTPKAMRILGKEYAHGRKLATNFRQLDIEYISGAKVWQIESGRIISYSINGASHQIQAKAILIATGAMERPVPIPGWVLPGVMGAAAADVIFKSSRMVPAKRVVLAGSGPLLYIVATRMIAAGADIRALIDTTDRKNYRKAICFLPKALRAIEYLLKGLGMLQQIRKSRIPIYKQARHISACGHNHIEKVAFEHSGKAMEIPTDTLFLHEGVIPNTQLARLIKCDHEWDAVQHYWRPVIDEWGHSNVDGIYIAGDTAGISGAEVAECAGHLSALAVASRLGSISKKEKEDLAAFYRKKTNRIQSVRPFLDYLYRPSPWALVPKNDETVVCRCEEVTAGQIRDAVKLGSLGPSQVKSYTRCGMGPCQGRTCGHTVSEIIADELKKQVAEVGYYHVRPPIKPITLGELADLKQIQ